MPIKRADEASGPRGSSVVTRINPPLPIRRLQPFLSSGSAFISYVRRRGEPDGGGNETPDNNPQQSSASGQPNQLDPNQNTTTDSDLSDNNCYNPTKKIMQRAFGYSSLRGPVKVGRPGGGGESDAAFTPSPPVPIQTSVETNVSLALAHQTRIRNLYSSHGPESGGDPTNRGRRPDSSSSTSSATDWEGSGHATVLRRAQNQTLPPMPPPRHKLPLVDSLKPLVPVYNNMNVNHLTAALGDILNGTLESTSSDSEFERGFEMMTFRSNANQTKPKIMTGRKGHSNNFGVNDRLSVRTENNQLMTTAVVNPNRTVIMADSDDFHLQNNSKLYFSPTDNPLEIPEVTVPGPSSSSNTHTDGKKEVKNAGTGAKEALKQTNHHHHQKSMPESLLRQINREMTPTISDVYHERNLGLGLAPPLSKLLLSKSYNDDIDQQTKATSAAASSSSSSIKSNSTLIDSVAEIETASSVTTAPSSGVTVINQIGCALCGSTDPCSCNKATTVAAAAVTLKKTNTKPWLSNVKTSNLVNASDLTTADILERQKIKAAATEAGTIVVGKRPSNVSPYSELSRRDEGDGRSVADSQCSGSFKTDQQQPVIVSAKAIMNQIQN